MKQGSTADAQLSSKTFLMDLLSRHQLAGENHGFFQRFLKIGSLKSSVVSERRMRKPLLHLNTLNRGPIAQFAPTSFLNPDQIH